MTDPANDFIRDYQALAQQSWDAWARQFQPQPAANPFAPPPAPVAGNDMLERTLAGLKGYFDWMQAAAAGGTAPQPGSDWRQQLQQMFGSASQPFAQAFGGIDSAGAEGFARQWQSWMQAAQHSGFGDLPGAIHLRFAMHRGQDVVPARIPQVVFRQVVAPDRIVRAQEEMRLGLVGEEGVAVRLQVPQMMVGVDERDRARRLGLPPSTNANRSHRHECRS